MVKNPRAKNNTMGSTNCLLVRKSSMLSAMKRSSTPIANDKTPNLAKRTRFLQASGGLTIVEIKEVSSFVRFTWKAKPTANSAVDAKIAQYSFLNNKVLAIARPTAENVKNAFIFIPSMSTEYLQARIGRMERLRNPPSLLSACHIVLPLTDFQPSVHISKVMARSGPCLTIAATVSLVELISSP